MSQINYVIMYSSSSTYLILYPNTSIFLINPILISSNVSCVHHRLPYMDNNNNYNNMILITYQL